ncbi:hypothetical protein KY336_01405 [Candidatus Woesearchaeota archaeon]|nr:hypothetical protein [Candidatus Woesearchaeota archaeon]
MVEVDIDNKKHPEKKIRAGPIAVAIWRNKTEDGKRTFYSVSFEKRYMDNDLWKSTNSLNKHDIPQAVVALQEAYRYLTLHKSPQELINDALEDEGAYWDNKTNAEEVVVPDEKYSKFVNEYNDDDEEEEEDSEEEE